MRKLDKETTSLGLRGNEMKLKSRNTQKTHLGPLLYLHTKFQLPSPIWRGDKKGATLFQGQKEGEMLISPLLIDLRDNFFIQYTTFDFLSIDIERGKFCVFDPSAPPLPN